MTQPRTHRLIRANGTEEVLDHKPSMDEMRRLIGCDTLDIVQLDRRHGTAMYVDDNGMVDGRPANPKATERYHSVCRPGTVWAIHGDVVIVNDKEAE